MKKDKIKFIAINAMIATVYSVLTIFLHAFSYGIISFRISEVLILLAFYQKKYIPGLIIGCCIANLASPMGIYDIVFGTISTAIVCYLMTYTKKIWIIPIYAAIITGIIIGIELWYVLNMPLFITMVYVALGEFVVLVIGIIIFKILLNNRKIKEILILSD